MNKHLAPLNLFWKQRNARERGILTAGGAFLCLALAYSLVFAPISKQRTRLRASLPELRIDAARFARDIALAKGQSAGAGLPISFAVLVQGAGLGDSAKVSGADTKHASLSGKNLAWSNVAQLLGDARKQGWTITKLSAHSPDGGAAVDVEAEWTRS